MHDLFQVSREKWESMIYSRRLLFAQGSFPAPFSSLGVTAQPMLVSPEIFLQGTLTFGLSLVSTSCLTH